MGATATRQATSRRPSPSMSRDRRSARKSVSSPPPGSPTQPQPASTPTLLTGTGRRQPWTRCVCAGRVGHAAVRSHVHWQRSPEPSGSGALQVMHEAREHYSERTCAAEEASSWCACTAILPVLYATLAPLIGPRRPQHAEGHRGPADRLAPRPGR